MNFDQFMTLGRHRSRQAQLNNQVTINSGKDWVAFLGVFIPVMIRHCNIVILFRADSEVILKKKRREYFPPAVNRKSAGPGFGAV